MYISLRQLCVVLESQREIRLQRLRKIREGVVSKPSFRLRGDYSV